MVIFNELLVKDTKLIIDVSIEDICYYAKMWIKRITVRLLTDNNRKVDFSVTELPKVLDSFCSAFYGVVPDENEVYEKDNNTSLRRRRVRLELNKSDLSVKDVRDHLYVIEVEVAGIPSDKTPCGMDDAISYGYTYYVKSLYNKTLSYIKDSSKIDLGFVDFILHKKALDLALQCGNEVKALEYFNLIKDKKNKPLNKCGCHG